VTIDGPGGGIGVFGGGAARAGKTRRFGKQGLGTYNISMVADWLPGGYRFRCGVSVVSLGGSGLWMIGPGVQKVLFQECGRPTGFGVQSNAQCKLPGPAGKYARSKGQSKDYTNGSGSRSWSCCGRADVGGAGVRGLLHHGGFGNCRHFFALPKKPDSDVNYTL
jgi:hypothetical protein